MTDFDYFSTWTQTIEVPDVYKKDRNLEISETHRRGISIAQLEELGELVERVLDNFDDMRDQFDEEKIITKENINLYHICDMFIKPLTEEDPEAGKPPCSFVELVATSAEQDPTWFVSHWWGTPFFDTLRMLKLHAEERDVDPSGQFYWICAFANCQHILDELEQSDYRQTPFAKAIMSEKCAGTLVVLNEEEARPFARSWCVFEDFVSTVDCGHKAEPHWMDFATIIPEGECENSADDADEYNEYLVRGVFNQRCAGLLYRTSTDDNGVTMTTEDTSDHPGYPYLAWFPSGVSMKGFNVDITKAEATREEDERSIQRWVGDRVDEVNLTLRRKFIRSAMYMAATEIGEVDVLRDIMEDPILTMEKAVKIADEEGCVNDAAEYVGPKRPGKKDRQACLRYLLEVGCDPNKKTYQGKLPLDTAFEIGQFHNVRLLLEFGADLSLLDTDCIPANCPDDIVRVLVENGVEF
mmetsp:Transcript_5643/g.8668  ORF Transcript_5643/g.8668 Transcript_5643/m.8668 type:complete len:468 (-) Transcript_5643:28-1431(-)